MFCGTKDTRMAEQPNPVLTAVAWLLIVLGAVWTLLTGGCTLVFLGQLVVTAFRGQSEGGGVLSIILVVGGLGVLPGLGMFFGGRSLLRSQRKRD